MNLDIDKILQLSCLKASEKEKKRFEKDLKEIFDFFDQIKDVQESEDRKEIKTSFLREDKREDGIGLELDKSKLKDGYFQTPPVFKQET